MKTTLPPQKNPTVPPSCKAGSWREDVRTSGERCASGHGGRHGEGGDSPAGTTVPRDGHREDGWACLKTRGEGSGERQKKDRGPSLAGGRKGGALKAWLDPLWAKFTVYLRKKNVLVRKRDGELSHPLVSGRIQAERWVHMCSFSFNSRVKMSFWLLAIKSVISLERKSLLHFSLVYNLKAQKKYPRSFILSSEGQKRGVSSQPCVVSFMELFW